MKIQVELRAFQEGLVREVEVPDAEWNQAAQADSDEFPINRLELVFYYGQNDVQNVPGRCSVSVGDVVRLRPDFMFQVQARGFQRIGD